MVIKSKQLLSAVLIIALSSAVAVNWYFTNSYDASDEETTVEENQVSGNLGDSLSVGGTTVPVSETDHTVAPELKSESEEYFSEAKLKRKNSHDQIIDNIEDIVENEDLSEEEKSKILVMLSDFKDDIKCETDTENLIRAKTGSDCIVTINNNKCQVILQKNTLNDQIILQITEIIEKNTNISAENLTIIEIK